MPLLLIQLINWSLLVVILVGIPAVASLHLGGIQLTSTRLAHFLSLWGLGLATGLNLLGGSRRLQGRKSCRLCRQWALVFALLFVFHLLFYRKAVDFHWLKTFLLWVQKRLS